jgi:Uma2 family endonuclease
LEVDNDLDVDYMSEDYAMTADELLRLPDDAYRYELTRGELKKSSRSGALHGRVAAKIIGNLGQHVKATTLGVVYASGTGFRISSDPDTVRAPAAAFVRAERVTSTTTFFEGAPDVAIEVVSPNDSYTEVDEKTAQWLRAGARVVVIVDPRTRRVNVHRTSGAMHATDGIEIEDVIPGWRMSLAEIFD